MGEMRFIRIRVHLLLFEILQRAMDSLSPSQWIVYFSKSSIKWLLEMD